MYKFLNSIPQKLSRVTSGGKLIKEIDGLRFIAIIPVMIQHMTERFDRNTSISFVSSPENNILNFLTARGFLGVYIFFLISGFVLALPFAQYKLHGAKKPAIKQYFWRRLTRLEPTYILWITVLFLIFVIHGHQSFSAVLPHYLANVTYTHGLIYHVWSPINPPTWTLEIEIQFYIIAPFIALLFFHIRDKITRRIVNLLFIFALMAAQQYLNFYAHPYNLSILGHLHYFLAGFMLADIYLCDWNTVKKHSWYDLVAAVSFISLLFAWSWEFEFTRRLLVVGLLFIFFVAVFKSNYVNRFVSNRWITAIGGMCYTIYLVHLPLAEFMIVFTRKIHLTNYYSINLAVQLLLFLPVALSLSAIFFLLFEKPFMNKNWPSEMSAKFKAFFTSQNL